MPTIERARYIQARMPGVRHIFWDHRHYCYRVIAPGSPSARYDYNFRVHQ